MEAPELFQAGLCSSQEKRQIHYSSAENGGAGGDHFVVEDLLDFSNEDAVLTDATLETTDSSTVTILDTCNSSFAPPSSTHPSAPDVLLGCRNVADNNAHFSGDLCVPYDELAELEWLSNFVEESFSSGDLQKLQLISGQQQQQSRADESSDTPQFPPEPNRNNPIFNSDMSVPAKARSKRSRAAPCNWTSRLLVLSPTSSSSESDGSIVAAAGKKAVKSAAAARKKESSHNDNGGGGDGRKCLHCATDKTPQWRTGPLGPKTLCNACGVRYKSGRLVPEYRPAASPTFVLTKHSNSHRKVMELRRQKEMQMAQQQQHHPHPHPHPHPHQHQHQQFLHHHHHQSMVFNVTNGDDYLIHQHVGPDFRQLI